MGVGTGGRGGGRRPNIFADHKNRYMKKKTNLKKKDEKFVFSCNGFVKFTGVIFANRDNCPQGVMD